MADCMDRFKLWADENAIVFSSKKSRKEAFKVWQVYMAQIDMVQAELLKRDIEVKALESELRNAYRALGEVEINLAEVAEEL